MASTPQRLLVLKTYKLFIGGKYPRSESGRVRPHRNPKGELVAHMSHASRKDFRDAVVAARGAQAAWSSRTAFNRGQILYRVAEMLESRAESFWAKLSSHAGYSETNAQHELAASVDRLVWYAGWSDKFSQLFGAANPVASHHFNITSPEPTGVVVLLGPPSAPLLGLVSTIAPIIVSGNAVVVVVDSTAPTLALELAEVFSTSDLPGGVVNILTAPRAELVHHIGGHRDVDAVCAVGSSSEERRALALEAAESVKRVEFFDDPGREGWLHSSAQSPYRILPFVEFKTAWHPVGY
ncbi:MAG: aldehyde dehydrogenase family protein [Myxococcota bacterium]